MPLLACIVIEYNHKARFGRADNNIDGSNLMSRPKVTPLNEQRPFEVGELFFSTTDRAGVILSGNEIFRRVAGFESVEALIGKPHNVIRHPDMPRAVFKLFWDFVGSGKPIAAYVKNMALDGAFYWVMAYAVPIDGGYLSVRFKPSSTLLPVVEALYKELSAIEAEAEGHPDRRQAAMEAAGARLVHALATLGFPSYDAFMRAAMVAEMSSYAQALAGKGAAKSSGRTAWRWSEALRHYQSQEKVLDGIFARVQRLLATISKLEEGSHELRTFAQDTHLLAMNGLVACTRMGASARGLSVVTQELAEITQKSGAMTREMAQNMGSFVDALNDAAFRSSAAKLQVGIATIFLDELDAKGDIDTTFFTRHLNDLNTLSNSLSSAMHDIEASLKGLRRPIGPLMARLDELQEIGKSLSCVYHLGQVEAAGSEHGDQFADTLQSLGTQVKKVRPVVDRIRQGIASVADEIPGFESDTALLLQMDDDSTSIREIQRGNLECAAA